MLFHARIAAGRWGVDEVAGDLVDKLVRRHPHVFAGASADDLEGSWEALKQAEKGRASVTDGVPLSQPALSLAAKLQKRGSRLGAPVPPADGLGGELWELVRRCREAGVDPEVELRDAARAYRDALAAAEAAARAGGLDPATLARPSSGSRGGADRTGRPAAGAAVAAQAGAARRPAVRPVAAARGRGAGRRTARGHGGRRPGRPPRRPPRHPAPLGRQRALAHDDGRVRALRDRYGPQLVDGVAGEGLLVDAPDRALAGPLLLETTDGVLELAAVDGIPPCVEFTRWALWRDDLQVDEEVRAALEALGDGARGWYAVPAGTGRVVRGARLSRG